MKKYFISIPFSVVITKEDSWESLDDRQTQFFIVRCHFQLNERHLEEPHKVGPILAVYETPKGVQQSHTAETNFEVEQLNTSKSIENQLCESTHVQNFVANLVTKAELPKTFSISNSIKVNLSKELRSGFSSTQEMSESCKVRYSKNFQVTNVIDPNVTDSIVAVPVYKRCAYDIILAFIDYLRVEYRRGPLGLRKKVTKHPQIVDFHKHPNIIKFAQPISTAYYWSFLPASCKLMMESDHTVEVEDSLGISLGPPLSTKQKHVAYPSVASLYQIANIAFPKKWIWRKSPTGDWTEHDLMKVELEEVKNQRGWWTSYGPGRSMDDN